MGRDVEYRKTLIFRLPEKKANTIFNRRSGIDARHISNVLIILFLSGINARPTYDEQSYKQCRLKNLSGSLKKADTIFNRRSGIDARHISNVLIILFLSGINARPTYDEQSYKQCRLKNLSGSLKKADTIFNRRSGIDARHISSISIFCRA
ncbi:hypothetical protein [Wielerella bovis]|uniref:hypothetical protein n=1 Tax=Wielerella bovis TaxID=2917790 RepID=UPI0020188DC6|nr:hypothetical protein [Wielerella bovis]MCG7656719.1 hypothetical protein [Wielerella bovis]MCG7658942.1 hypothetical protein [Wielerella bovis]